MILSVTQNLEIRHLLEAAVRAGLLPGVIAVSERGGRVSRSRYGYERLGHSRRFIHDQNQFDLASLTKVLATTPLAMIAMRSNALRLETQIADIIPEAHNSPYRGVTVEQLLTHTSGLPAWSPLYCGPPGRDGVINTILSTPPRNRPGITVEYSCLGFILLGFMLEIVLGERLDQAFFNHVAKALRLEREIGFSSTLPFENRVEGARSTSVESAMLAERNLEPTRVPPLSPQMPDDGNARFLGGVAGNAGLFGTARGVLHVARQFLPGVSTLFDAAEIFLVSHDRTGGMSANRGLGWQMASSPGSSAGPALSVTAYGHTGFTGCSLWIDPQECAILMLLSHRHHPEHRLTNLHPLRRRFHSLALR